LPSADHTVDGTRREAPDVHRLALDRRTGPCRPTTCTPAPWRLLHNNNLLRLLRLLARRLELLLVLAHQALELLMVELVIMVLKVLGRCSRGARLVLALMVVVAKVTTAREYALACSKLCSERGVLLHRPGVLVR